MKVILMPRRDAPSSSENLPTNQINHAVRKRKDKALGIRLGRVVRCGEVGESFDGMGQFGGLHARD